MTKETAIALLNNLRAFSEDDDEPAIDMAIEALQDAQNCVLTLFGDCSYDETGCGDCEIKQTIYKALSIDLVRCGGCKFDGKANCAMKFKKPPADYCSYGERRSDE